MKDAFQLMLKHSKKRREEISSGATAKTQDSQKRKREYENCPVCLRSIPTSFLDIHAKTCLESCHQQSQQQGPSQCAVLLPPSANTSSPDPGMQRNLMQATEPEERAEEGRAAEGGGGSSEGTQSALHVMMQAQRRMAQQQQPQNHVFYLEWDDGHLQGLGSEHTGDDDLSRCHSSRACETAQMKSGTWRCYWWKEGPSSKKHGQVSQGPHTTCADSSHQSPLGSQQGAHHQDPSLAPPGSRPRSVPCWSASTVIKEKGRRASEASTASSSPSKSDSSTSTRGGGGPAAAGAPCHVLLQTNVPPGQGGAVKWQNTGLRSNVHTPAEGVWRGHPSALKSALQKAVRRGMAPAACRLCLQMLKDDPSELLRRLPIICLEDTIAHPTLLPVVVWLMGAQSKGYALGALHAAALLDMTYQLTCVGIRDHLPTHPPTLNPGPPLHSFSAVDNFLPDGHSHPESVLIKAMLLRAHYGGMAGDVESCKGYAALWCARFAASHPCRHSPPAAEDRHPLFCNVAHPPASPAPSSNNMQPAPPTCSPLPPTCNPRYCNNAQPPAPSPAPSSDMQHLPPAAEDRRPPFYNVAETPAPSPAPSSNMQPIPIIIQPPCSLEHDGSQHVLRACPPEPLAPPHQHVGMSPCEPSNLPHPPASPPHTTPQQRAPQQLGSVHHQISQNNAAQKEGCQGVTQLMSVHHQLGRNIAQEGCDSGDLPDQRTCVTRTGAHDACHGSTWFAYLCSLYGGLRAAPMELSCVEHVGALRRSDVPLAAIDFHVSDIVEHLLGVPRVAEAAKSTCCSSWGIEGDTTAQMRNAMWLFRSSVNYRAWLPLQRTSWPNGKTSSAHDVADNQVDMDLVAYEHQPLIADLEQEAAQKDRLLPMWQVTERVANQFASSLIANRFQSRLKV